MKKANLVPRIRLFLCVVFLVGFAYDAQAQSVTLSATSRSFGSVAVGSTSAARTVTLTNTSTTTALSVTNISPSGDFAETNTCGSSVAAGRNCVISITFTPTALGARTGSIVITDNATPATQTITLTGTGIALVTVSPTSHGFGSVAENTTSAATTLTVRNNQAAAVSLTVAASGPPFAETDTCGGSVAASSSCTVSVTFSPTVAGAQTGSVTITYTGAGSPQTVTLTGTGVSPITITPASHAFGSVGEGTTSAASTFTVRNYQTTAAALTISTAAPFAETDTCGGSVAASSTCTISATFSPTVAGAQSGSLSVAYTGTGSPLTATLTGTGVTPITITPASRAFGSVTQGTTSAARTFTVKNNTTAAMPISISSSNPEFVATGCGTSLAAGASCTLSVTFAPAATATGSQTGSIAVAYTGTGSPQSVSVTGTALTPITVSPSSIAFSTTRNVGTASAPHSVTITNSSASTVAIGSIVASPAAYAITANTCPSSLAATATCTVTVVFTPTVTGTTNGTLTIPYGISGSQLVVSMTGGAQVNNLLSIAITEPNASIPAGTNEQLTATGTYASGTTGNVTSVSVWSSSNTAVASVVSTTGVVTGVSAGSVTITAAVTETTGTTVTNTATLTVTGKALTGITITGTQGSTSQVAPPTLAAGTNLQLYATGKYSDGSYQDITTQAAWSSTTTNASVTAGLITAKSMGNPTITASLSGITGSTGATVTAAALQSIAITPATATVAAGNTQQFTATGTYTDQSTQNITSSVTWSSSISSVVMSTETLGLATTTNQAVGMSASIGATLGTVSATTPATLTVSSAALVSIAVSPANQSIALGTTQAFTATGTYTDNNTQDLSSSVTWSAATLSGGGAATFTGTAGPNVVQATGQGAVSITATSGSISGSTSLTVTAPLLTSILVTSTPPATPPVAGTPAVATLYQGQTKQFYALGTYSDSSIQNITTTVAWSAGTGSVATVSTSGATAGLATGVAAGTVSIVATSNSITSDPGGDGSLTVVGLNSVTITPTTPTAALGDANAADRYGATNNTLQFTATANYADKTTGNVTTSATWTSGTPAVATIGGATGLATVLTAGTSAITAIYAGVSGSTVLTVSPALLESIAVTPASVSLGLLGTQQFAATGTYSDGTTQDVTGSVTWTSATPTVVSISSTGLAQALAYNAGISITASERNAAGTLITSPAATVIVPPPTLLSITVGPPTISLAAGYTQQYTATGNYSDGSTQDLTASATWASSSTAYASITSGGLASALTIGTTTISATSGTVVGSTTLTVTAPALQSIAVCLGPYPSPTCGTSTASVGATLGLNATQQFSAVGTYSDNSTQNLTNTVTWQAHDPVEVNVNSAGLATVLATDNGAHAITAGYGTIAPYLNSDTGWVTASSTLPISCPTPTIDMKLLVVNNAEANSGAGYVDFPAIQQILNYVGTPYDVVDVTAAAPTLSDGACHGYYQGVIFAYGGDYYSIPGWQSRLISYEQTFGVRQLNWYDVPDTNFGLSYSGTQIPSTQTYTTNFTAAAASVFFYANTATPLTITNASVDLATGAPAAGGTLTPLLQDTQGNIVSAIYTLNGQQFLSQTFDSNPYLMHDLVVAYGLLNWVTKGVFLGDYHVYTSQQVDDFFIDDSEWIPSTQCLTDPITQDRTAPDASNLPVFRVNLADMTQLVAWQNGVQNDSSGLFSQFKLTMAFNGVGTARNGEWTGLTAPVIATSSSNDVATFVAQGFSGQIGQTATVTGTTNDAGRLNGTWTILSVTSSAATTPGTTTFTATVVGAGTVARRAETGTVTAADELTANLQSYQGNFHWISHTYNHPSTLNGLCQSSPSNLPICGDVANGNSPTDDIDLEVLTNRWVASDPSALPSWMLDNDLSDSVKQLTFTDFNSGNIVTPGITGLSDPNVPTYLFNDGVRYAVSDTSVIGQPNNGPNPSPNVGIVSTFNGVASGIYEVPRHPNDVFYNAANWADDQAEFVCIYSHYVPPNSPPGTVPAPDPPFNAYNASQILDFTSSIFVTNMLMGDMDPQMFHQPDLHFSDNYPALTAVGPPVPPNSGNPPVAIPGLASPHVSSLLSDTYDLTFSKYKALYKLPVLSPTLDQLGVLMKNRNSFNLSGVTASIVGAGTASATITITMPSTATVPTAVIPVTGLTSTGSEVYGGQNISHISMAPGQKIIFNLP